MTTKYFCGSALAGVFFGVRLMAQPLLPVSIPFSIEQTTTTGIIGFTANQTARLSVLNLNPVPTNVNAPANCTVELQFFDPQNNSLKAFVVPNFAPQMAAMLDLDRKAVTAQTGLRAQIRGAVTVNPAPTPVGSPAAVGYCSIMVTLEIFDNTTGSTVVLTGDTRTTGTGGIVPLVMR